jgi:hypothetical protein
MSAIGTEKKHQSNVQYQNLKTHFNIILQSTCQPFKWLNTVKFPDNRAQVRTRYHANTGLERHDTNAGVSEENQVRISVRWPILKYAVSVRSSLPLCRWFQILKPVVTRSDLSLYSIVAVSGQESWSLTGDIPVIDVTSHGNWAKSSVVTVSPCISCI